MMKTNSADAFVKAATAWGACHGTRKFSEADLLYPILTRAEHELRSTTLSVEGALKELIAVHANPWVRYCAAIALARTEPQAALPVLEALALEDGIWSVSSQIAVFSLKGGGARGAL
jgi:hypothetical protein